ncbi:MAG: PAS domain S-box protein, partial [Betaproteobacteria bacterium]|nr:PAS domain S-box protein [Betaproteobacteria bacterium]
MNPDFPGTAQFHPSPAEDDARRIATLFQLVPRSMAITAATAVLAAVTLSGDLPAGVLSAWLGTALVICAVRYGLYLAHARDALRLAPRQWENAIACGALAMGCAWAALTVLGPLPAAKTLFVALVLAVAAQSSTGILSSSARAFSAFAVPVTIALAALLFRESGGITAPVAIIAALFVFALATAFLEMRRAQLNFLRDARLNEESFRQQRLIFDAVHTGIAVTRNRIITDFNPRAAAMFGYTREELIGKPSRILFYDDATWEHAGRHAFPTLYAGKTFHAELTLRAKSGAPVTCETSMDALTPGRPDTGIVVMMNDVTERRRLESSLKAALVQQQAVFDNAPVGIAFTRDRKLVICNERMLSMFGYALEELVGRDGRWLYADEAQWSARNREIAEAFARGQQVAFQEAFVTKNGSTLWCQMRGSQVQASDGAWGTAVFTFADISERKRMEETLRESREQLDLVIQASLTGIWDWNIAARELTLSPRYCEILGHPRNAKPADFGPMSALVHPDDQAAARAAFIRHLKSHEPVSHVARLKHFNGSWRWLRVDGMCLHGPDGRATRS